MKHTFDQKRESFSIKHSSFSLSLAIKLGEKREIIVVTLKALKKDGPCTITISTPSGQTIEMKLALVTEGYSTFFQPTEVGKHTVTITYGYMNVPKSPFTIMVEIAIDFGKVQVKGLESRKYELFSGMMFQLFRPNPHQISVSLTQCQHHNKIDPLPQLLLV